ncbi:pantothenate kinase Cab1p [[Candida] anglica]|uniref:Pantothenate kinase Cab1p n=1 Tax=[Candida] anglica TaxID=148631 RepID=A0ABP0E5Y8_9ASCO
MGKKSFATTEELNLELVDPGTIRIDCSGAYIGNDYLLRNTEKDVDTDSSDSSKIDNGTKGKSSSVSTTGGLTDPSSSSSSSEDSDSDHTNSRSPSIHSLNGPVEDIDLTKNITLPQHNSEIIHISVDIGGTLTKLVYFTKNSHKDTSKSGGKLHFKDFQTEHFQSQVLKFMIKLIHKSFDKNLPPITYIMATGGGANKFHKLMTKTFQKHKLPMKVIAKDEMECLIRGLDWFITKIPNEIFIYDLEEHTTKFIPNPYTANQDIYPYLLVNIGSGVSMIKVTGPGPHGFERIGGSSLGGGTLWGLLSLLTEAKDYNEMLEMASRGDNENIDLLVGDIYGSNYNKIGLKSNHIASSFAKVFKKLRFHNDENKELTPLEKLNQFKPEDIARSLLYSVSNNIGQIAYLQALRFKLQRIYFGGSYISGHKQTIHTLSYAVNFWSNGDMKSYFLRHEGYLGSVGAFIMGPDSNGCISEETNAS